MLTYLIPLALNSVMTAALLYWAYRRNPSSDEYGIKGSSNVQGTGHTVHYHPPSREMTETEKSLKETIDLLGLQLYNKQKMLDHCQSEKLEWKERYLQLKQQCREKKKQRKRKHYLPVVEMELR